MALKAVFRSVKFRLTISYAFILTIFLSVFAYWMHAELSRALYRDVDNDLLKETRELQDSFGVDLSRVLKEEDFVIKGRQPSPYYVTPVVKEQVARTITKWERKNQQVIRSTLIVRLISLDGAELASNLRGWQRDIIFPDYERDSTFVEKGASFQVIHFQDQPIRLYYHMVRFKGHPLLVVQLGSSIKEVRSTLQRLAFIILISIPGAVAAACIAGWFLAKRSFHPIDMMIREARQITAAYLKSRLPRTHAKDELDRLAETLNEMIDRLEASTRSIQDFSSNISHELKTPLAIIRGEVDLALRRPRSSEALVETLRVIEEEVNELIRLVDDLMLLVRHDSKQLRLEKKRVSLGELFKTVGDRYHERAKQKKIRFSVSVQEEVFVEGDDVYLKRLFSNLIDNAIKFTPEDGEVGLKLKTADGKAFAEVYDTGMGIELEVQEKVFSRFFRTDQARSHEGSGLGLNIVKAICDAHQASLEIKSQPGKGTQIFVFLPLSL